jgi:lysophospholipase L1-like esterase
LFSDVWDVMMTGIDDPLVACCGGDGRYHTGKGCDKNATVWGNPAKFASWDGVHMTEKAYSSIADGVLNMGRSRTPRCSRLAKIYK